jgi:hypothetical protein
MDASPSDARILWLLPQSERGHAQARVGIAGFYQFIDNRKRSTGVANQRWIGFDGPKRVAGCASWVPCFFFDINKAVTGCNPALEI